MKRFKSYGGKIFQFSAYGRNHILAINLIFHVTPVDYSYSPLIIGAGPTDDPDV